MESVQQNTALLQEAERRLRRLSADRLRVAEDFIAYLEEREESEATEELLSLSGFEAALRHAVQQADAGQVVPFKDVRPRKSCALVTHSGF